MSAPTAATLRAVARRADRLAEQIRALADLVAGDPDLNAGGGDLLAAAEAVHVAASGVLAAADALPRRRPRPRTGGLITAEEARQLVPRHSIGCVVPAAPKTAEPVSGSTGSAKDVATRLEPHDRPAAPARQSSDEGRPVLSGPAVGPPADDGVRPRSVVAAAGQAPVLARHGGRGDLVTCPRGETAVEHRFTTAAGSAPRWAEPTPAARAVPVVCPPSGLRARGRAALARLRALAARVIRPLPSLRLCMEVQWR